MAEFYREAFAIALGSADHALVPAQAPATLEDAGEILGQLTPRQRCDAIYADWLLQLHSPGGRSQIQIRNLLLGQGAMDAHYLAELTQNADDARASALVIALEDDWLLVANNGRPLNPLNLLGLCRFFVHSNGQVVGLTPDTIGKFGIGFKASHRVAEEVVVGTWAESESEPFAFRLPIALSGTPHSRPDPGVLDRIVAGWQELTSTRERLLPEEDLGHCTPEFIQDWSSRVHAAIQQRIKDFTEDNPQGTWFAMRLHSAGRKDAEERLADSRERLFEVTPMFLRTLRRVTLQDSAIELTVGKPRQDTTGDLRCQNLTFRIKALHEQDRLDRFLLLQPESHSIWKLAVPVNSEGRLYSPDGSVPLSSNGRLHAHLPLSGLIWPHGCHLHLDLPPNLSRSAWNPDQAGQVRKAISEISAGFSRWLARNTELWHSKWQPAMLLRPVVAQGDPASVAQEFSKEFSARLREHDLVRSIWGGLIHAKDALELLLEEGSESKEAWFGLAERLQNQEGTALPPIVPTLDGLDVLELPRMTTEGAWDLFSWVSKQIASDDFDSWENLIWCAFTCLPQHTNPIPRQRLLELVFNEIPIRRESGTATNLQELSRTRGRCRLLFQWHSLFDLIYRWLPADSTLCVIHVFGTPLKELLKNLGAPSTTPTTWEEVLEAIKAGRDELLKSIWEEQLPPCPHKLRSDMVEGLRVTIKDESVPLTNCWVLDRIKNPLKLVLSYPPNWSSIRQQLDSWGLRSHYVQAIQLKLSSTLPTKIEQEGYLTLDPENIFVAPDSLPSDLRETCSKILSKLFIQRLQEECPSIRGKKVLIGEHPAQDVLVQCPSIIEAPRWLSGRIVNQFCLPQQIDRHFGVEFIISSSVSVGQREMLGRLLLDEFHHWMKAPVSPEIAEELATYLRGASGNWTVRLPGNVTRFLNQFVDLPENPKPDELTHPVAILLAGQDPRFSGLHPLPRALSDIEPVKSSALSLFRLNSEVPGLEELTFLDEPPKALSGNRWFNRLRAVVPDAKLASVPSTPRLAWTYGEGRVTIADPAFSYIVHSEGPLILVFGEGDRSPEEDGAAYEVILHHYATIAPEDQIVRRRLRNKRNLASFYRANRERIVHRLREVHATELGYEARHVLRELLQNAETSYGTCSPGTGRTAPDRSFRVDLKPVANGSSYEVVVQHHGRAFNEPLANGAEIRDIDRICAIDSTQPDVPGWRGRFNKGFKSIFQVTDQVHIESGAYCFEIQDLILLNPGDPQPDPENDDRPTTFRFTIPLRVRKEFLRERGRKEQRVLAFTPDSIVFLNQLDQVSIREEGVSLLDFSIQRDSKSAYAGWSLLSIKSSEQAERRFLLHSQERDENRVGVAVELDQDALPVPAEKHNRRLYRTFPLEQPAEFASFYIEADFTTDQGRLGLVKYEENSELVLAALQDALGLFKQGVEGSGGRVGPWLSWVEWINLRSLLNAADIFPSIQTSLRTLIHDTEKWLLDNLPHRGALRSSSILEIASPLLYRISAIPELSKAIGLESNTWLHPKVANVIRPFLDGSGLRLPEFVNARLEAGHSRNELLGGLKQVAAKNVASDAFEQNELTHALNILDPPFSTAQIPLPALEDFNPPIAVEDLLDCWNDGGFIKAPKEFTLAGPLGQLVSSTSNRKEIRSQMQDGASMEGKALWYRLLCLGCSFSIPLGPRPADRVLRLWKDQLGGADFWTSTIPASAKEAEDLSFNARLDKVFETVIHKRFTDANAGGEDATFWRRVFYDFRKMHHFVFRNHLPETVLEFASYAEADGSTLVNFLRSGQVPDTLRDPAHPRFEGVIGQSMKAPLLFVMRELRLLGVLPKDRFDQACFYMNSPARRIAARLGWIEGDPYTMYDFSGLLTLSENVHKHMAEEAPELLPFFDLPLQWYALQHPS